MVSHLSLSTILLHNEAHFYSPILCTVTSSQCFTNINIKLECLLEEKTIRLPDKCRLFS